jgi:hypothetical protein
LFRGDGLRFTEVKPRGGTAEPIISTGRGAAFGDVDGDGAVDILIVSRDAPASLLINAVPGRGHAILLRAVGPSGADALGAHVELKVGERRVVRDVRAAYSYQSSNDPRVHVGLGDATRVEDVTVTWPDGAREAFGAFEAGTVAVLARGAGTRVE